MRRASRLLLVIAAIAITVSAAVMAFAALQPALQDASTRAAQDDLRRELADTPKPRSPADRHGGRKASVPTASAVKVGEPIGTMRIPRFGADWDWVLLEGADDETIANGPGHYADTVLPGARGNVGVAAHRAGHGDPFIDFDKLRRGDEVQIQQGGVRWIYRLDTDPRIVPVTATWVLRPHPRSGAGPVSERWRRELTLTTCWPKYGSSERMFVRGTLTRVQRAA